MNSETAAAADFDAKRQQMLYRLNARHSARQQRSEAKVESDAGSCISSEDRFLAEYQRLQTLLSSAANASTAAGIAEMRDQIESLQQQLNESYTSLSAHLVRKCQQQLNGLRQRIQQLSSGGDGRQLQSSDVHDQSTAPKTGFHFKVNPQQPQQTPTLGDYNNATRKEDTQLRPADLYGAGWSLDNKSNENVVCQADACRNKDTLLHSLANCKVAMLGVASTMHLRSLDRCTVFALPVATSIMVDDCRSCTFYVAGQQLRMHDSIDCEVYLHVSSRAIIENCRNLRFAAYSSGVVYCNRHAADQAVVGDAFAQAQLEPTSNNWNLIDDFDWLTMPAVGKASPNWSFLPEHQRTTCCPSCAAESDSSVVHS